MDSHKRAPFGFKTGWLACATERTTDVADAILPADTTAVPWSTGVTAAVEHGLFVCPPVDGWTLVVGKAALDGNFDLAALSQRLGCSVQRFGSHRVVDFCLWARADDGQVVRHFEYVGEAGEIVANFGELTAGETEAGVEEVAGLAVGEVPYDTDLRLPDEETVTEIAAKWSIDPTKLSGADDRLGALTEGEPPAKGWWARRTRRGR